MGVGGPLGGQRSPMREEQPRAEANSRHEDMQAVASMERERERATGEGEKLAVRYRRRERDARDGEELAASGCRRDASENEDAGEEPAVGGHARERKRCRRGYNVESWTVKWAFFSFFP